MKNLILLHGALGSAETLQTIKNLLSDEYTVFDLDFPGHGRNEGSEIGMEAFTDSLRALIENNRLAEYSIFGYSMGGFAALKFAAEKPAGLKKIITLGTKFDWTPESAAGEVKKLNPELIEEKVPKFAAHLASLHNDWKELMNKTASMMLQLGEERGLSRELLSAVNVPVHLYRGSEDNMVSSEETRIVADLLPDSSFEIIEGVQHPIDRVDPVVIADLIRKNMK